MNVVFLSGGSGKRLWPLSNDIWSKQFLKLLKNDVGEYESMVQRAVRQLKTCHHDLNLYISCNSSQNDILKRQLGSIETILEPLRRDTFPAIALAAAYLRYKKHLREDEVFVVCPIDVYADKQYFELLTEVERTVKSGESHIGLMGALPTIPTSKYGYIKQTDGVVTDFAEKPSEEVAADLISRGALWNCGVFALKIGHVLKHVRKHVEFDSYEDLHAQYGDLPKISFDYEVVEKETSINVTVYDGTWKDIGSWATLTDEMRDNALGNVIVSEQCSSTHALNMLNIPMVVHDINDSVIVASHDGIMVCGKKGSASLKPLTEQIEQRPMYEQRRWGDYRVLDYKNTESVSSLVKRLRINAGQAISYQYHNKRSEVWVIVSGEGILTIDGADSNARPGRVIHIPVQAKHSISAITDMEFIEIQLGEEELEESDIVRV